MFTASPGFFAGAEAPVDPGGPGYDRVLWLKGDAVADASAYGVTVTPVRSVSLSNFDSRDSIRLDPTSYQYGAYMDCRGASVNLSGVDFTIRARVRIDALSGSQTIAGNFDGQAYGRFAFCVDQYGALFCYDQDANGAGTVFASSSAGAVQAGEWVDVTLTRAGSMLRMYAGTTLVASTSTTARTYPSMITVGAWADPGDYSWPLTGYIDEVEVIRGQAIAP